MGDPVATVMVDRTASERALHHVQIVALMATLALTAVVPFAGVALLFEAVLYRRVRLWFRVLMVAIGVATALFAFTSVS